MLKTQQMMAKERITIQNICRQDRQVTSEATRLNDRLVLFILIFVDASQAEFRSHSRLATAFQK